MLLDTRAIKLQDHKAYNAVEKTALADGNSSIVYTSIEGQPVGKTAERGKKKMDTDLNSSIETREISYSYAKATVLTEDIQTAKSGELVVPLLEDAVLNSIDKKIMSEAFLGNKVENLLEGLSHTGLKPIIYMSAKLFAENASVISQLGLLDNVVIDSTWFKELETVDVLAIDADSYRLHETPMANISEEVLDSNSTKWRAEKGAIGYMVDPTRAFYIGEMPTTTTTTTSTTTTSTTTTTEKPTTTTTSTTTTTEQPVAKASSK